MPIDIEQYAMGHTSSLSPLLREIIDFTTNNHPKHHMISGPLQGQLLQMISCMLRPSRILEIGTFTGFSAICLAAGLKKDGVLHTLELRDADALTAQSFFDRSPYKTQIKLHIGPALETLKFLNEVWDLVFIDADKTGYCDYLDSVLPNLRQGGVILADNVLFHGEVLKDEIKGKNASAIAAFNTRVMQTPGIECTLLTIRDGLMMIRKL